jgi:AcrR family transcriptional regulator
LLLTVLSVRILRMPGIEQAAAGSPVATARVDEILRAACRVVVAGGASDLRIGSVAQEAGVSRTLVHYYFTTRQELLRATFAYAEDLRVDALEEELAGIATGAERAERALMRTIDPALEANPALWNEVWSSLRYDDELRPLVQERYRAWAGRIVRLLEEGRRDGSVPVSVDAEEAGWRLAAAADGVDSILYLGVLVRDEARELLASCFTREVGR